MEGMKQMIERGIKGGAGRVAPRTPSDMKLSNTHLRDSIRFNMSHAKDHIKHAKKAMKTLAKQTKKERK